MTLLFKICGLVFSLTLLILLTRYDKHHGTGGDFSGETYVGNNPDDPE